ncbi:MAG: phosphate starvation-inducible protein PhoH, partial [Pseudomonadota bacterium]
MNAKASVKAAQSGASDLAHIVLTYDNNAHARALYGQYDQNLALIEQQLGVDVRSRGNQVSIKGEPTATEQARRALDHLYDLLAMAERDIEASDVEGALRMAVAADDQLNLPEMV